MILHKEKKDVVISGDFESKNFTADLKNSKIFEILSSGVYTDPVRAVIRELSINALDSHIEANQDKLIDIHLPTRLESWFSVRDYGTGIKHNDCMELYSCYGYSTKSDSNDYTGALGIGSKSPLSLVDSFTVTSFIDGVKNHYSIFKNDIGVPQIAHLLKTETDEPNGFLVKVEIKQNIHLFETAAVNTFKFWDKLPNINNENVIKLINEYHEDIYYRDDKIVIMNRYSSLNKFYIVMGNVGYEVPSDILRNINYNGYVRVDIGDFNFNSGRESLLVNDKTNTLLSKLFNEIENKVAKNVEEKIEKADTVFEKALLYNEHINSRFKNKQLDHKFKIVLPQCKEFISCYSKNYNTPTLNRTKSLPLSSTNKKVEYFWLQTGYVGRIKQYLNNSSTNTYGRYNYTEVIVLLTEEQADQCKIDKSLIQNLDILPKIKKNTQTGLRSKTARLYTIDIKPSGYDKSKNISCINATEEYDKKSKKIYISIFGEMSVLEKSIKSPAQYIYVYDFLKENFPDLIPDKLYGVRNNFKRLRAFKDGDWQSLDDYLIEVLKDKKIELKVNKTIDHSDKSCLISLTNVCDNQKIKDAYDEISNKTQESNPYVKEILERLNIKTKEVVENYPTFDKLFNDYPMLSLYNPSSQYRMIKEEISKIINNYIK